MPHSSTVALLSYWRGLQVEPSQAPLRDGFDPSRLKHLIPQMLMISMIDEQHRFRLSGGFLTTLHGRELKDTPFLDRFRPEFVDAAAAALTLARHREQPLVLSLSAPWQLVPEPDDETLFRNETVEFEIALCPLRNGAGRIDRMVGLCQTLSRPPRRLNGRLGPYSLIASRLHAPEREPRAAHLQLITLGGRRIA